MISPHLRPKKHWKHETLTESVFSWSPSFLAQGSKHGLHLRPIPWTIATTASCHTIPVESGWKAPKYGKISATKKKIMFSCHQNEELSKMEM